MAARVPKESIDEVATLLLIRFRTVHRYVDRFLNTGDVILQDHRYGPARLLTDFDKLTLINLVLTNKGIYLHTLHQKLMTRMMTWCQCQYQESQY